MSVLDLACGYFENRADASDALVRQRPLQLGVLGFVIGGLSAAIARALTHGSGSLSLSSGCLLSIAWALVAGFLFAAVVHLILEMQGVKGDAGGLFIGLGLSSAAWALAVPLALLARLLAGGSSRISMLIFLTVGGLALTLKARAIKDNYHVSLGRAWFALSLPYVAIFVMGLLLISVAVIGLLSGLFKAF